jgi:hypothetical protein
VGLEEEAVVYLLQRATSDHQIRSAFTRGSVRASIYEKAQTTNDSLYLVPALDRNVISLQSQLHIIFLSDSEEEDPDRASYRVCLWLKIYEESI